MARSKTSFSLKSMLPHTLFGRSLLILVLPVLLIQMITTIVFFDRHWTKMTSRLAFAVAGEVAVVTHVLEGGGQTDILNYVGQHLEINAQFEPGAEFNPADQRVSRGTWESMVTRTLVKELGQAVRRPFYVTLDLQAKDLYIAVQLSKGVLKMTIPTRRLFSSSSYIFLLWMFGSSLILLAIAILFMRNQIRPIRRLAVAAERFGKGRDVPSFRPSGAREVRQASQAFIDMHRRIKRQMEQRTAMLAGVSHDLRTPLTRLKLEVEMMENEADKKAMKDDILEMERMIGGYLEFVRGEGDEDALRIDLQSLMFTVMDKYRRQGLIIHDDIAPDLQIMLQPMAFQRCLGNLLGNAAAHADTVWVGARYAEDDRIEIAIEDNGPGIPEGEYDDVFKPFYRGDTARNTKTGSVGLGMPIAMDVVHSHGGKIWLEKSEHGGLKVCIRLPV